MTAAQDLALNNKNCAPRYQRSL